MADEHWIKLATGRVLRAGPGVSLVMLPNGDIEARVDEAPDEWQCGELFSHPNGRLSTHCRAGAPGHEGPHINPYARDEAVIQKAWDESGHTLDDGPRAAFRTGYVAALGR
jgi:hypothetical protein